MHYLVLEGVVVKKGDICDLEQGCWTVAHVEREPEIVRVFVNFHDSTYGRSIVVDRNHWVNTFFVIRAIVTADS